MPLYGAIKQYMLAARQMQFLSQELVCTTIHAPENGSLRQISPRAGMMLDTTLPEARRLQCLASHPIMDCTASPCMQRAGHFWRRCTSLSRSPARHSLMFAGRCHFHLLAVASAGGMILEAWPSSITSTSIHGRTALLNWTVLPYLSQYITPTISRIFSNYSKTSFTMKNKKILTVVYFLHPLYNDHYRHQP